MAEGGRSLFLDLALCVDVAASHAINELGLGVVDQAEDPPVKIPRL